MSNHIKDQSMHSTAPLQMSKTEEKPIHWLNLRCYERIQPHTQIQSYSGYINKETVWL